MSYVFSMNIYAYGHFVIMQLAYMASPSVSTQFATHAVDPAMLASPLAASVIQLLSFRHHFSTASQRTLPSVIFKEHANIFIGGTVHTETGSKRNVV